MLKHGRLEQRIRRWSWRLARLFVVVVVVSFLWVVMYLKPVQARLAITLLSINLVLVTLRFLSTPCDSRRKRAIGIELLVVILTSISGITLLLLYPVLTALACTAITASMVLAEGAILAGIAADIFDPE